MEIVKVVSTASSLRRLLASGRAERSREIVEIFCTSDWSRVMVLTRKAETGQSRMDTTGDRGGGRIKWESAYEQWDAQQIT